MSTMICKLQVPLYSSLPPEEHLALIYNENRSFEVMRPITPDIVAVLRGRPKIFVELYFTTFADDRSGFIIKGEAPSQTW
jgi:hypothetical protein